MTERNPVAAPFTATTFYAGPASLAGPASTGLTAEAMLTTEGNRWSAPGEPTIYLAGDLGVALAELGRHAPADPEPSRVWSVNVELDQVVDLRADRDSSRLFDREYCRTHATRLRTADACEGILVPSVAMLDRPDRWNLVVFTDRLRRPLSNAVRRADVVTEVTPATVMGATRGR